MPEQQEPIDLMIMLATQQQIVNYKTFKHYNPRRVVALCSKLAQEHNWCHGFQILLNNRFKALPPYTDAMMDVIKLGEEFERLLNDDIKNTSGRVVWAWAGAQKPHSTALFILARKYKGDAPSRHIIVYAEGNSNAFYEDGQDKPISMHTPLTAEEVLVAHGLEILGNPNKKVKKSSLEELSAFLNDQSEREREWQLPPFADEFHRLAENPATGRNDIIDLVTDSLPSTLLESFKKEISKIIKQNHAERNTNAKDFIDSIRTACANPFCNTLFTQAANQLKLRKIKQENISQRPSGLSFELHARARMQQWYDVRGKNNNLVSSMSFDVDVEGINQQGDYGKREPESAAQFDCLLVTPQGRFIAIDFKSAGKRNYRAQQASVTIAGGVYAALYYLYPWIEEDLPPEAGTKDTRPDIVKKRMDSIKTMDKNLRPDDKPPKSWRGIRFYKNDEDFFNDLESVLNLK